jgi:hypothetical protein
VSEGRVYVLEPAQVLDQVTPGIWLDEGAVVTGASAAQLAYAITIEKRKTAPERFPYDVQSTALLTEKFPLEVAEALKASPIPATWLAQSAPDDRALLVLSLANLLAPDCLRLWFQQDPLVQAGRAAIGEFGAAAFDGDNSVFARNELAMPINVPPRRRVDAVRSGLPREKWQWVVLKGAGYRVSDADVRPGDPDVELRFALTWDRKALHFHAEALDTPAGFRPPAGRRSVELFVNPKRDGLVWLSRDNFQFAYTPDGSAMEFFHNRPVNARFSRTEHGYTVDSDIAWTELGIAPKADIEFDLTASITAAGTSEWDPSLELSWRYYERADERFGLGTVHLSP